MPDTSVHEHTPNCLVTENVPGLSHKLFEALAYVLQDLEAGQVRRLKAVPSHGFAPYRLTRIRVSTSAVFVSSVPMFT